MNREKIGKFIQELRKEKGMTQEDLANELSTVRETVSKWERGVYVPNNEMLVKLGEIFDVSINEIFYGERKNKYNNKEIDAVPLDIMTENKKRIKKILTSSTIVIILLAVSFLAYYFIDNYNSIHVHKISVKTDNILINNGIMILSKEKSYFQLGNIENFSENQIEKVRLFYKKDDQEVDICFSEFESEVNYLLINDFRYSELFQYRDFKDVINNLYLEIIYLNEDTDTIKLIFKKDFSNNKIFDANNSSFSQNNDENINQDIENVPEYFIKNFKWNEEKGQYYLSVNKDNKVINSTYSTKTKLYSISETNNNIVFQYDYFIFNGSLSYYQLNNGNVENDFTYDLENEECVYGKCDSKIIDYFKKTYLVNLK